MVGFVIWIVGLILTIKAALEIGRLYAPWEKKLLAIVLILLDRKSTRLNSSHGSESRMPSSA